jgi:putative transposase
LSFYISPLCNELVRLLPKTECLNEEVFASLAEARAVIERWRLDYNHVRPHSAHGGLTPETVRLSPAAGRLRNLEGSKFRQTNS